MMKTFHNFGKVKAISVFSSLLSKTKNAVLLVWVLTFGMVVISKAATINVPADQPTIQAAVNAAAAGDVIMVADGTYNESVNLATGPAGITIQAVNPGGATVNGGAGSAFYAANHTGDVTIDGFVLTSALADAAAGVIHCTNLTGQLTVINNNISANDTDGVSLINSGAMATNVAVLNNTFGNFGNDQLIFIAGGQNTVGGDANIVIDGNSNTGVMQDDAIHVELEGSGQNATVVITDNNFNGWTGSGSGIELFIGDGTTTATNQELHFIIDGNTLGNADGDIIWIDLNGVNTDVYGIISNNTINGDGVNSEDGIWISSDDTADGVTANLQITGNMVSGVSDNGIFIDPFSFDSNTNPITWNLVIDNNTIDNPNADDAPGPGVTEAGILIGEALAGDENYIINAEITNNTITNLDGTNAGCIQIEEMGLEVVNYEESGNSCPVGIVGTPTAAIDPVPGLLDLLNIGDLVWNDLNGDGIKDAGESGIGGVEIMFSGNGFSGSTFTNASGNYLLPALTPGTYTLTIVPPADYPNISPTGNDSVFDPGTATASVTLTAGSADDLSADAGIGAGAAPVCNADNGTCSLTIPGN